MAEDVEKIERIKSNLRSYLNEQPNGEHAEQAKRILVNLQANAPSLPSPSHQMKNESDVDLGIESGPIVANPHNAMDRTLGVGTQLPGGKNERASEQALPARQQTELEGDPIAQQIVGQAMTMPALHVAGLGLSAVGRKLLQSRAGQAAKFLADQGAPVAAPKPTSFLEPPPEFDPMGDLARARAALAMKAPSTAAHYGSLGALLAPWEFAARNAAPMAGRAALPLMRAGAGAANVPLSAAASPLFQAVMGKD